MPGHLGICDLRCSGEMGRCLDNLGEFFYIRCGRSEATLRMDEGGRLSNLHFCSAPACWSV